MYFFVDKKENILIGKVYFLNLYTTDQNLWAFNILVWKKYSESNIQVPIAGDHLWLKHYLLYWASVWNESRTWI